MTDNTTISAEEKRARTEALLNDEVVRQYALGVINRMPLTQIVEKNIALPEVKYENTMAQNLDNIHAYHKEVLQASYPPEVFDQVWKHYHGVAITGEGFIGSNSKSHSLTKSAVHYGFEFDQTDIANTFKINVSGIMYDSQLSSGLEFEKSSKVMHESQHFAAKLQLNEESHKTPFFKTAEHLYSQNSELYSGNKVTTLLKDMMVLNTALEEANNWLLDWGNARSVTSHVYAQQEKITLNDAGDKWVFPSASNLYFLMRAEAQYAQIIDDGMKDYTGGKSLDYGVMAQFFIQNTPVKEFVARVESNAQKNIPTLAQQKDSIQQLIAERDAKKSSGFADKETGTPNDGPSDSLQR